MMHDRGRPRPPAIAANANAAFPTGRTGRPGLQQPGRSGDRYGRLCHARCGGGPRALPPAALARVLGFLEDARDLASTNASCSLFRGAPGGHSPVERALRERATARGHERALPDALPTGACSWVEVLLAHERVLEMATYHACAAACNRCGEEYCAEYVIEFSALVDADGRLHTCGERLLDEVYDEDDGLKVPAVLGQPNAAEEVLRPTPVASLAAVRVCAVAAGYEHLLALSDGGAVYACGDNSHGELGLGDKSARREFAHAQALRDVLVVGVAAGGFQSLALGATGCAYSWGINADGQLGHGDTEERWEPTRIEALHGVRVGGMSAGGLFTLLPTTGGEVYSCGSALAGQLGHGDQQDQRMPRRIEALAGVRAVHVSAGASHSLVVDAAGRVHGLGRNSLDHCLAHADANFLDTPVVVSALAGVHAVRACAGCGCSAVVGADGSVYTFGSDMRGQLGAGVVAADEPLPPMRVAALAGQRVVDCSLGSSHSLLATADGHAYSCGELSGALGHGVRTPPDSEPADALVTTEPDADKPIPLDRPLLPLWRRWAAAARRRSMALALSGPNSMPATVRPPGPRATRSDDVPVHPPSAWHHKAAAHH